MESRFAGKLRRFVEDRGRNKVDDIDSESRIAGKKTDGKREIDSQDMEGKLGGDDRLKSTLREKIYRK